LVSQKLGNLRAAVTAERNLASPKDTVLPSYDKSAAEREMIKNALLDNFFFRKLNKEQVCGFEKKISNLI